MFILMELNKIIKNKIFINGYVLLKNKQQQIIFYWECEKSSHRREKHYSDYFNTRIIIMFIDKKHVIRGKVPIHNHAPDVGRLTVEAAKKI
jgi:hypothetical protein